jgi:CRP-like cAMP-binding protein
MKPLLTFISDELRLALFLAGRSKTFNEGAEILREGSSAATLPIVVSGRVKMIHFLEPGKEVIIGIFGEGEMFAVPPVFDGAPYPATAVAMEKTKLLLLARPDFIRLLGESREFSFTVIEWLCAMLREKTATIQNLATASPAKRAGNVLLRLAQRNGPADKPLKIMLRRRDIAEMAGLSTETTIRVIRDFAEKKLVEIDRGKIVINDAMRLREYLAD